LEVVGRSDDTGNGLTVSGRLGQVG
jgi:hypothetical protein